MGAWIEISLFEYVNISQLSHPTMGAWIEIKTNINNYLTSDSSHPTMGAWIEIS